MNEKYDKQKLLDLMGAEYDFVERTLLLVPENLVNHPNVVGYWSAKDTIAQLSAWQKRVLAWLDNARRGAGIPGAHPVEPEPGFTWDDEDAINTYTYEQYRDRAWDDIVAEFEAGFEQVFQETEQLTEAELFSKSGISLFFREPLWGYIAYNTFMRYSTYIEPVRAWLAEIAKFQTTENPTFTED